MTSSPSTRARGEAVLDELLHLFFELAFAAANDGRHDHDAVIGRQRHDALHDLVGRLAGDGLAAIRGNGATPIDE